MVPVKMRLLTYNILKGGEGREAEIVEVIRATAPDVVIVPWRTPTHRFLRPSPEQSPEIPLAPRTFEFARSLLDSPFTSASLSRASVA